MFITPSQMSHHPLQPLPPPPPPQKKKESRVNFERDIHEEESAIQAKSMDTFTISSSSFEAMFQALQF